MPAMPAVAASPVPMPAVTTPITRMVIASTVVMAVPAMAPFVADVTGRYDDSRRRGRGVDRRRGCGRAGQSNPAKCGEANKCRNNFHDIHLLTSVGGDERAAGSAHYAGLMPMK